MSDHNEPALPVPMRHVWVLMPLMAPFGIGIGFLGITLGFQLQAAGMAIGLVSAIIASSIATQTWKFLWAPLVDTLLGPRSWYAIGVIAMVATILVACVLPRTTAMVPWYVVLGVISGVASSLTSMAAEIIMTQCLIPAQRGQASGWAQAGNVGGNGVGGGLGLVVAQHFADPLAPGVLVGAICMLCFACLWLVPNITTVSESLQYGARLAKVGRDVIDVVRTRTGALALAILLLPIASGEAPFQLIGPSWQVGGDMVALISGTLFGLVALVGALGGGYCSDRLRGRTTYMAAGIASGLVTSVMALAPHTPALFAVGVLAYALCIGGGFAAYSAIVLDAIGRSSGATNFNLMSALSNIPLAVMTAFDGWMVDAHGVNAMLYGELWLQALAVAGFVLFVLVTHQFGRSASAETGTGAA